MVLNIPGPLLHPAKCAADLRLSGGCSDNRLFLLIQMDHLMHPWPENVNVFPANRNSLRTSVASNGKPLKPAWPEQIQDTHEHDYVSLCVANQKK